MLKSPMLGLGVVLLTAVFLYGIIDLFALRFERGDLYPPYSSLRTDPLGTSVLYESLARCRGVTVRRYLEPTFHEDRGRDRTLLVLGLQSDAYNRLPKQEFENLQRFVLSGGRLVLAYSPQVTRQGSTRRHDRGLDAADSPGGPPPETQEQLKGDKPGGTTSSDSDPSPRDGRKSMVRDQGEGEDEDWRTAAKRVSLKEAWGFQFEYRNLLTNEEGRVEFASAQRELEIPGLPLSLSVHTALGFANLTNGWTTIYQRDEFPVMVERRLGGGSVVLVADAYPFSNEALFKAPASSLLVWLVRGTGEAVFEEAHLGVGVDPGLAALLRKYRLHGLILSLLLWAGLFIWKNSQSLVPPWEEAIGADGCSSVTGKNSIAGFVNLLRRGITPHQILNACFDEWKRTGRRRATRAGTQQQAVERLISQHNSLPVRQQNPVATYRAIRAVLREGK